MCDLWKNTTLTSVPAGAIPAQIDFALSRLPEARHIKLYNSGNFFDPKAVSPTDWPGIADRVRSFKTVIVENHPSLCGDACPEFQQMLRTQLEVAMGLETSHVETLARLNKRMTIQDFSRASAFLLQNEILVRAFVLLKPPWTSEEQAVERAIESVRFAFDSGVTCCSIIPVRAGNGIMEQLADGQQFSPPKLSSLETVLREALSWNRGRVFADLWDAEKFADDPSTAAQQIATLQRMNLTQQL
jgi:hypothetical protein